MKFNLRQKILAIESHVFDWLLGVETKDRSTPLPDAPQGIATGEAVVPYIPTPWRSFAVLMKNLEICEEDVFVDVGCGKGRALLIAAQFPFKKLLGFEIDSGLCEKSKKNLSLRKIHHAEVHHADACQTQWDQEMTFFYLARPFNSEQVSRLFYQNLQQSLQEKPRSITLICHGINPAFDAPDVDFLQEIPFEPKSYHPTYRVFRSVKPSHPK